jgi:hypothetical protein
MKAIEKNIKRAVTALVKPWINAKAVKSESPPVISQ